MPETFAVRSQSTEEPLAERGTPFTISGDDPASEVFAALVMLRGITRT
jgi:hypothetical protein